MSKATVQYTTKDLKELGFIVEVPGRTDNARNRAKALEEIQRRMEDSEDTTVNEDSFADGLSADDLILVEPLGTSDTDGEEAEIIQSVKAIASLASLRVNLEQAYQQAVELRPVIEALFSPDPLTPEHMKLATDRNFAKTLTKFAEAKAAHDQYLPIAKEAWEILEPALPPSQHQANPLGSEVVEHTESNGKKGVAVNES
ncbi:hypothetical protein [Moorena sp. SIO3H5]|uniref:hypothetical protein n=1 Tax=Moorena sp. SIO3H5 TaxID=2607834 RepID=UPI0013BD440E|nr:hypothetical protein [Moorena sp. SIO3H5]NEO72779.1 hypothetical protein [Moorena sp. SIO3H5]